MQLVQVLLAFAVAALSGCFPKHSPLLFVYARRLPLGGRESPILGRRPLRPYKINYSLNDPTVRGTEISALGPDLFANAIATLEVAISAAVDGFYDDVAHTSWLLRH
jgi:hypothetical protein